MPVSPLTLLLLGFFALVAYALWIARKHWPIKIVVTPDGMTLHRGVAQARVARLREYFAENVQAESKIVIHASRHRSGRLDLKISGRVPDGTRQQIRNYLNLEL